MQETFTRERNERVLFARLVVRGITSVNRMLLYNDVKTRAEIMKAEEKELLRWLDMFEAEVHQDVYRPDVAAAISDRLARRNNDANFAAKYDEALQRKVAAFEQDG